MAELDQAVTNLERFIGLLANATTALGQVEDHVVETGRQLEELEEDAGEEGGRLNDRLEELATVLQDDEAETMAALGEITRAASEAQQDVTEVQGKVEEAASDLDQAADQVEAQLEQARTQVDTEGFEAFDGALEAARRELEASSQETEQGFGDLAAAASGLETEAESAANEVAAEVAAATGALAESEAAVGGASEGGVQAFAAAADAMEDACGVLVTEVDLVYDALDAGVDAQGAEWEQGVDAAAQEALAFVGDARRQRLEAPAALVRDEALAALGQELEAVGTVLDEAGAPAADLEPLSAELARAQTVVRQIDELMNAIA
jgi:hypothetical protein